MFLRPSGGNEAHNIDSRCECQSITNDYKGAGALRQVGNYSKRLLRGLF